MDCPKCEGKTLVLETRGTERRRQCQACSHRFSTREIIKKTRQPDYSKIKPLALSMLGQGIAKKVVAIDLGLPINMVYKWAAHHG